MSYPDKHHQSILSKSRKELLTNSNKRFGSKIFHPLKDQWKNTSTVVRSPSAVIGTTPKMTPSKEKSNIPGPGQYELNRFSLHHNDINFKGSKLIRFNTDSSGSQGIKDQKISTPSRKISISQSVYQSKNLNILPSSLKEYLIADMKQGVTFAKQTRENIEKILNKDKSLSPGPGKYKNVEIRSSKNLFSFSKTKKFSEEEKQKLERGAVPAPGLYHPSDSRKSLKGTKFTQAIRMVTEPNQTPGPGTHNSLTESSLSHLWGTIGRDKKESSYGKQVPGPGSYNNVDLNKVKRKDSSVIIGKSSGQNMLNNNVKIGPSYYFKEKLYKRQKIAGGTIDRSLRNSTVAQKRPGPLDYSLNFNPVLSRSKHVVFGKQRRYPEIKDISLKPVKESLQVTELRMSNLVNSQPYNIKHDRQINRSSLSHY